VHTPVGNELQKCHGVFRHSLNHEFNPGVGRFLETWVSTQATRRLSKVEAIVRARITNEQYSGVVLD
jgi:hypothetical protein